MFLVFTPMAVTQRCLYLLLAESKPHLLQSQTRLFLLFGGSRKVWSCAFDSSILLMLLAICALRHDFVLRTGLKCSALFLILILFHFLLPFLFLPFFDFQTIKLYFLYSTRFFCFFFSPIAL